jgi:hypothetical protein
MWVYLGRRAGQQDKVTRHSESWRTPHAPGFTEPAGTSHISLKGHITTHCSFLMSHSETGTKGFTLDSFVSSREAKTQLRKQRRENIHALQKLLYLTHWGQKRALMASQVFPGGWAVERGIWSFSSILSMEFWC